MHQRDYDGGTHKPAFPSMDGMYLLLRKRARDVMELH